MTVTAGRSQSRSNTEVAGSPASATPSRTPQARAEAVDVLGQRVETGALGGVGRRVVVPAAVERGVAVLVDQRREHPGQAEHRIGHRAAGHAAVHRTVERADAHVDAGEPAQGVGEAGRADRPVAGVGEEQHVGAQRRRRARRGTRRGRAIRSPPRPRPAPSRCRAARPRCSARRAPRRRARPRPPCRRRCRGRRGGRRARGARTARTDQRST